MIRVVALGPGAPEAVPAAALDALAGAGPLLAPPLDAALVAVLGAPPAPLGALDAVADGETIVAPDA
jgi:hypothetical protein